MKNLAKNNILKKYFQRLWEFFTGSGRTYLLIFLLLGGLCCVDVVLKSYSSIHQLCLTPWDIVRTIVLWTLLLFSFVLFGGKHIRIILAVLVVWMMTIDFLQFFMLYYFHRLLGGEIIFIFLLSSWNEVKIFLEEYLSWSLILIILTFLSFEAAIIFGIFKGIKFRPNFKTILSGLIGISIFLGYYYYRSFHVYTNWPIIMKSTLFAGAPYSVFEYWKNFQNILQASSHPQLPRGIQLKLATSPQLRAQPILGLIIIGESASRNYMNLYGYPRNTTPQLNKIKDELLIFNNLCGSASNTCQALQLLFSQATIAHPENFKCTNWQVLKQAGFNIIYISSQEKWGTRLDGLKDPWQLRESIIFKAVDKEIYTYEYNQKLYKTKFDKALLPIFIDELKKNAHRNTIICLHLLGSHFPPHKFYPTDFCKFSPDFVDKENQNLTKKEQKRRNNYDNSIAYTDEILNELLVELKKIDAISFALYISDHGETPNSKIWRDEADPDLWELPLIVWLSDQYRQAYPSLAKAARKNLNQPMQSEFLFWSILALAQITTDHFPEKENIFSLQYAPPQERFIQNGNVKYIPIKRR